MADNAKYMTSGIAYSEQQTPERSNWLRVDMLAFPHGLGNSGTHELRIKVYTYSNDKQEVHFDSTLNELIELILLGKLHKAQLQAETKLCDLCGKPTTGQNPHYDCAQREAYLADSVRELQNNG